METFTTAIEPIENPFFDRNKTQALRSLDPDDIDKPILNMINRFNEFPFAFTLQCCYGHFLYGSQKDEHNLLPLPEYDPGMITYRIAYLAFCIKEDKTGLRFRDSLMKLQEIDKDLIQFGSADWFLERYVNSYVLQVEPERFKYQDTAQLTWKEALNIEKIRHLFFTEINDLLLNFR